MLQSSQQLTLTVTESSFWHKTETGWWIQQQRQFLCHETSVMALDEMKSGCSIKNDAGQESEYLDTLFEQYVSGYKTFLKF